MCSVVFCLEQDFHDIELDDGTPLRIFVEDMGPEAYPDAVRNQMHNDHVQHYASQTLELGLLMKNFLGAIKVPNRARMLRSVKLMMVLIKAQNSRSKYADELLRFLVHQVGILSEHDAHMMFYSMFVNTKGKIDTNIPCDLQMEYIVNVSKKHIKHMLSNKSKSNIMRRTGALASLDDIVRSYDGQCKTTKRNGCHSTPTKEPDELVMIQDLHGIKPFDKVDNRSYRHFPRVDESLLARLAYDDFFKWVKTRSQIHATSVSN